MDNFLIQETQSIIQSESKQSESVPTYYTYPWTQINSVNRLFQFQADAGQIRWKKWFWSEKRIMDVGAAGREGQQVKQYN